MILRSGVRAGDASMEGFFVFWGMVLAAFLLLDQLMRRAKGRSDRRLTQTGVLEADRIVAEGRRLRWMWIVNSGCKVLLGLGIGGYILRAALTDRVEFMTLLLAFVGLIALLRSIPYSKLFRGRICLGEALGRGEEVSIRRDRVREKDQEAFGDHNTSVRYLLEYGEGDDYDFDEVPRPEYDAAAEGDLCYRFRCRGFQGICLRIRAEDLALGDGLREQLEDHCAPADTVEETHQ